MALMKITSMEGVNSFKRASAIAPEWMSQRAPVKMFQTLMLIVLFQKATNVIHACGWQP